MIKASLSWQKDIQFECDNRGIKSMTDANPESGGHNSGPTPKELVLNAMMGCTAMDVVSILKKMRQDFTSYRMDIEAVKTTEHPMHFESAIINYHIEGVIDGSKIIKAVESSMTKYCGVNYMISKTCDISYRVFLNGSQIHSGKVNFEDPQN